MKWLLDENLPRRLINELSASIGEIQHVADVGLQSVDDEVVWEYAAEHGLTIVSKDSDFQYLSARYGSLPKVNWLRVGNCSTRELAEWVRQFLADVRDSDNDAAGSLLVLGDSSRDSGTTPRGRFHVR